MLVLFGFSGVGKSLLLCVFNLFEMLCFGMFNIVGNYFDFIKIFFDKVICDLCCNVGMVF